MRDRPAVTAESSARALWLALIAITAMTSATLFAAADASQQRQKPKTQQQHNQPATGSTQDSSGGSQSAPSAEKPVVVAPERPSAIVLNNGEVSGILGNEVRSAADENMGRIVDVLVDQRGRVRAAVIDFGGFLGVGSRKIAVDWNALHFSPGQERNRVIFEMTRDQVKAAPEYQEGKPIFVLSAATGTEPVRFTTGGPGR
jgi:hypothetical protein